VANEVSKANSKYQTQLCDLSKRLEVSYISFTNMQEKLNKESLSTSRRIEKLEAADSRQDELLTTLRKLKEQVDLLENAQIVRIGPVATGDTEMLVEDVAGLSHQLHILDARVDDESSKYQSRIDGMAEQLDEIRLTFENLHESITKQYIDAISRGGKEPAAASLQESEVRVLCDEWAKLNDRVMQQEVLIQSLVADRGLDIKATASQSDQEVRQPVQSSTSQLSSQATSSQSGREFHWQDQSLQQSQPMRAMPQDYSAIQACQPLPSPPLRPPPQRLPQRQGGSQPLRTCSGNARRGSAPGPAATSKPLLEAHRGAATHCQATSPGASSPTVPQSWLLRS